MSAPQSDSSKYILIVDDDEAIGDVLMTAFMERGFRVVVASNVTDAIRKASLQKFTSILLDMRLRHGSGEDVLQGIRAKGSFNERTPVVMMSGFMDAAVVNRLRNKVSAFLSKPFRFDDLLAKIEQIEDAAS